MHKGAKNPVFGAIWAEKLKIMISNAQKTLRLSYKKENLRGQRERTARNHFYREKHLENHISLKILPKIEGSRLRIQAQPRISAFSGLLPAISVWVCYFSAIFCFEPMETQVFSIFLIVLAYIMSS